jgi:hypothetical protein
MNVCVKDQIKVSKSKSHKRACSHIRKGRVGKGSLLSESGKSV